MNDKIIDNLNEILRGERSALETYVQVLSNTETSPKTNHLLQSKAEHIEAVQNLKQEISSLGGQPSEDSGAWGDWAKTITGTAHIFGDKTALKALKEGEEHGLKLYQELKKDHPEHQVTESIANKFIPRQKAHIDRIDSCLEDL
ncbi:PA2169 family four-helix-bundle protein [bacterium]|nr:PA2169 family four-helix-bundle protein [bacterium]